MSKVNQSELLVENETGEFVGKITSLSLFNKKGKLSSSNVIDKDCVFIDHDLRCKVRWKSPLIL